MIQIMVEYELKYMVVLIRYHGNNIATYFLLFRSETSSGLRTTKLVESHKFSSQDCS